MDFKVKIERIDSRLEIMLGKTGDILEVKDGFLISSSGFHWGRGDFQKLSDLNEFFETLNTSFELHLLN